MMSFISAEEVHCDLGVTTFLTGEESDDSRYCYLASNYIADVQGNYSTWDRTNCLLVVRFADPADRRCDIQSDGRTDGQQTDRQADIMKVLCAF